MSNLHNLVTSYRMASIIDRASFYYAVAKMWPNLWSRPWDPPTRFIPARPVKMIRLDAYLIIFAEVGLGLTIAPGAARDRYWKSLNL